MLKFDILDACCPVYRDVAFYIAYITRCCKQGFFALHGLLQSIILYFPCRVTQQQQRRLFIRGRLLSIYDQFYLLLFRVHRQLLLVARLCSSTESLEHYKTYTFYDHVALAHAEKRYLPKADAPPLPESHHLMHRAVFFFYIDLYAVYSL